MNNPGFIRALEIYQATNEFGPPDELNLDVGGTRALWQAGRCALTLDWGDIGTLAIDPEASIEAGSDRHRRDHRPRLDRGARPRNQRTGAVR